MLNDYRFHAGQVSFSFHNLKLIGSDVSDFLQKQSTFNISNLHQGFFHLTSFLDPQGRMEFYAWLLNSKDGFQLLIPIKLYERALERLNRFLVAEDVEILDQGLMSWTFALGANATHFNTPSCLVGELLEEHALLSPEKFLSVPEISFSEFDQWRLLNGWPTMDGEDFKPELINNLRLYDLSVSENKGCYPGQETVSKIATRRGAAFSPVLLELTKEAEVGPIMAFEKKIGEAFSCIPWSDRFYLASTLLRDFRVAGSPLGFTIGHNSYQGIVRYFPILSGESSEKAKELFYAATDDFKFDRLKDAEEKLKMAIQLDPGFADAYESLGVMLGRQERFQEAIEWMKKLSSVDSNSVLAHTNMSLYLMRLGRIEEAEAEKSQATLKSFKKFGDEAKSKEMEKAQKEQQEKEWAQRESMFLQVLEIDPEDSLANYGLGSIAVERKEWDRAITHLESVLRFEETYSVAYLALGKAYQGKGLAKEAKEIWKRGITIAAKKGDLMPANQMQSELERL